MMKTFLLPDDLCDEMAKVCPSRGQTAFVISAIRAALRHGVPPVETLPAEKPKQVGKWAVDGEPDFWQ